MNNFFSEFDKVSLEDWKSQIITDLKGKEHSILEFTDPIEELDFKAYYHQSETSKKVAAPGNFPYTRGMSSPNNNWGNGTFIQITDESEANKKALDRLMCGADYLVFKALEENCNWSLVLADIQFEYIKIQFTVAGIDDYQTIRSIIGDEYLNNIAFNFDFVLSPNLDLDALVERTKNQQHPVLLVNGFAIQQSGANTWQEIAFCLNTGHEYLLLLMNKGLTIDEASALIHFHVGIGNNYFNEIAKLRVLRELWAKLVNAYSPEHNCTYNAQITAVIGHLNKSLKDPYTNLLRQTTETMSAANGANYILVLPYDLYKTDGPSVIAERMALNLSLILKEESYMDKVIDPTGGSYTIEQLTELIGFKAWSAFQKLESQGGIFSEEAKEWFTNEVEKKREERISSFRSGRTIGIGMNKYPDPKETNDTWQNLPEYMGLKPLLLDLESENIAV